MRKSAISQLFLETSQLLVKITEKSAFFTLFGK